MQTASPLPLQVPVTPLAMASDSVASESPLSSPTRCRFVLEEFSIPPPLPLMPRSMCMEVEPKSYLSLLYSLHRRLRRYPQEQQCVALSPCFSHSSPHTHSASIGLRSAMESW